MNKDVLDEKIIGALLYGSKVVPVIYDTLDSTNLELKRRIRNGSVDDGCNMLIIADEQSAGRGRLGRTFESPGNTGIYMSLLIKPCNIEEDTMLITTAAAVAVTRGIAAATGIETGIKWVNDIYLDGKKICGILAESLTDAEGRFNIILGIGINVTTPENSFDDEVKKIAGSLYKSPREQSVSRNEIIAVIINSFMSIYEKISEREYMNEYRKRSIVIGKPVKYSRENVWHNAYVTDIDNDGGLVVEEDNNLITLRTGEITLRLQE